LRISNFLSFLFWFFLPLQLYIYIYIYIYIYSFALEMKVEDEFLLEKDSATYWGSFARIS
jgi:hypothetical protein